MSPTPIRPHPLSLEDVRDLLRLSPELLSQLALKPLELAPLVDAIEDHATQLLPWHNGGDGNGGGSGGGGGVAAEAVGQPTATLEPPVSPPSPAEAVEGTAGLSSGSAHELKAMVSSLAGL